MTRMHKIALTLAAALGVVCALALSLPAGAQWSADVAGGMSAGIRPAPAPQIRPLPPTYWYAYKAEAQATGAAGGFANLIRFLVEGTGSTYGGSPGYTLVEMAQDAGWGAGACAAQGDRAVPPTPGDVDSCGAWAPAVNDWVWLRSGVGLYGTRFNLYLELQSTTVIYVLLAPLENVVPAPGAFASPPGFPAATIGAGAATPVSFTVVNGAYRMSVVAAPSAMLLLSDSGAGARYNMYVGETTGAPQDGVPADTRPFVIWDGPSVGLCTGSAYYINRIAPDDGATAMVSGLIGGDIAAIVPAYLGINFHQPAPPVYFTDAGRINRSMGSLRWISCSSRPAVGGVFQTAALDAIGWTPAAASSVMQVAQWDGVTTYAGAAAVVFSGARGVYVPRNYIRGGNH